MPSFILKKLTLCSLSEKRARRFSFHPRMTIVKGDNDTGKSSLLKSIYRCFGANPAITHDKWKGARVISVLTFTIDGQTYHALQNQSKYSFYDADRQHLASFDSVTKGVAPYFANMLGFGLKLPTRQNDLITPPPAYLLLPFYIDQDAGWKSSWSSFARLDQFAHWKKDLAEYHVGIRPNEYYQAKGQRDALDERLQPLVAKQGTLKVILLDLEEKLRAVTFDIDIEAYQNDVKELLVICDGIKKREEELRDQLTRHYSSKTVIETQITIAKNTLGSLKADLSYIEKSLAFDYVDCPMCGAVYENSFEERLAIAQDEDRLYDLLSQLETELIAVEKRIEVTSDKFINTKTESARIEKILNTKRGELRLRDLIENEGRKEVQRIIRDDISGVEVRIAVIQKEITDVKAEMDRYDNAERRKEITKQFREQMRKNLFDVEVHTLPSDNLYVYSSIKEMGSDLPRALLAYYYSILHLMKEHSTAAFCPIVLDSPNQQEQDLANLKRVLVFIRDKRPKDSQIVLGLVDDCDLDFDGDVIELTHKYELLQAKDYASISAEVRDLLDKARVAGDGDWPGGMLTSS